MSAAYTPFLAFLKSIFSRGTEDFGSSMLLPPGFGEEVPAPTMSTLLPL